MLRQRKPSRKTKSTHPAGGSSTKVSLETKKNDDKRDKRYRGVSLKSHKKDSINSIVQNVRTSVQTRNWVALSAPVFFNLNSCLFFMCTVWIAIKVGRFDSEGGGGGGEGSGLGSNRRFYFYQRIHWIVISEKNTPKIRQNGSFTNEVPKREMRPKVGDLLEEDMLPEGCVPAPWQELSFPTCNVLHEIDVPASTSKTKYEEELKRERSPSGVHQGEKYWYVGNGFWRDVWRIKDNVSNSVHSGVVKTMRLIHDEHTKNFERHRRDAMAMEQLTSNPYVVNIYGFCGNTVFTEYVGDPLNQVLYDKMDIAGVTRKTPEGRRRIALHVSRGLDALHSIPGGAIAHTDIAAKQFLIDPSGMVRINDFNRCRFVAHNNITGEPCPFKIPFASGTSRSPEEYKFTNLTEKMDVYSLGHVFYGLFMGQELYSGYRKTSEGRKKCKKRIIEGSLPRLDGFRVNYPSDKALVELMKMSFVVDPEKRAAPSDLVALLENGLGA